MKRTIIAIVASVMFGLVLIPSTVEVTSKGVVISDAVAAAAISQTDCTAAGGVWLSVQINRNSSNCVLPDANGGVIVAYLKQILLFLSAGVGIVVLLMLTIAGVQYITAAGQPEQVKAAKTRIQNAITGLVLFLIAFAVLNLIIPGGIFT
jgi:Type IV secretion system pilin